MKKSNAGAVPSAGPNYRSRVGSIGSARPISTLLADKNEAALAAAGAAGYFLAASGGTILPMHASAATAPVAEAAGALIGLDGAPMRVPKLPANAAPAVVTAPAHDAVADGAPTTTSTVAIVGNPQLGDELDDAGLSPLLAFQISQIPTPFDAGPAIVPHVFAPLAANELPPAGPVPASVSALPVVDASIGARVWIDANSDGVQNAGELGAAGVTVQLENTTGTVLRTVVTDAAGHYAFSQLAAGEYQLQFVAPAGFAFTAAHAGADPAIDSDANANGLTSHITLGVGEHNTSVDAGLLQPPPPPTGSIGDHIWIDWNSNGLWDNLGVEFGAVGLTVKLLDAATGAVVQTTQTDATGAYLFTGVEAGQYQVQFSTLPLYTYTTAHAGTDPAIDSDADPATGLSQVITLAAGENNLTIDAGLIFTGITPIVLDLDHNGIRTTALDPTRGEFDLLANGAPVHSGWISAGDAFLAIDLNGNGVIDSRAELFGGTKMSDGFAQLAAFDTNHDGMVDANDANFGRLRIWQDLNDNHRTDPGELRSLAQAGITGLSVAHVDQAIEQNGNVLGQTGSAILADGSAVTMTDVSFGFLPNPAAAPDAAAPALAEMLVPSNAVLDHALGSAAPASAPDPTMHVGGEHDDAEHLRRLAQSMQTHAKLIAG